MLINAKGLTWLAVLYLMVFPGLDCLAFGGLYPLQEVPSNTEQIEVPPPLLLADHCRTQSVWYTDPKRSRIGGNPRKNGVKRIAEGAKQSGSQPTGPKKETLERIFANTKLSKALVKAELVDLPAKNSCPHGWVLAEEVGADGSFRCRINPRESVQTNLIFCEKPLRYFARGQTIGCFMG